MEATPIKTATKQLWEYTVDVAITLCTLLEQDVDYKNIRLLYQSGQLSISNNFKDQKEALYPINSATELKSLSINANNPKDLENPMQTQVVLHFQPQLENTVCVVWNTDEQLLFSLEDHLNTDQLAQDLFVKVKSKL